MREDVRPNARGNENGGGSAVECNSRVEPIRPGFHDDDRSDHRADPRGDIQTQRTFSEQIDIEHRYENLTGDSPVGATGCSKLKE